jgi:hypothetical protein
MTKKCQISRNNDSRRLKISECQAPESSSETHESSKYSEHSEPESESSIPEKSGSADSQDVEAKGQTSILKAILNEIRASNTRMEEGFQQLKGMLASGASKPTST